MSEVWVYLLLGISLLLVSSLTMMAIDPRSVVATVRQDSDERPVHRNPRI